MKIDLHLRSLRGDNVYSKNNSRLPSSQVKPLYPTEHIHR